MRYYTKFLFSFLVPLVFLSFSCVQVISEKSDVPTETDLISDKAKESTVRIVGLGMRKSEVMMGGGTGFFIAPDKIATNFHVAANCTTGPITAKLSHKETGTTIAGMQRINLVIMRVRLLTTIRQSNLTPNML